MSMSRLACIKISVPAVVVFAAAVGTAMADESSLSRPHAVAPDLSWAVHGGATHSVRGTRVYLARTATTAINSWDRLCGAQSEVSFISLCDFTCFSCQIVVSSTVNATYYLVVCSSHQCSAP